MRPIASMRDESAPIIRETRHFGCYPTVFACATGGSVYLARVTQHSEDNLAIFDPHRCDLEWEVRIALAAVQFFGAFPQHSDALQVLGRTDPEGQFVLFSGSDFIQYLAATGWGDQWSNASNVQYVLTRLSQESILADMGPARGLTPYLRNTYITMHRVSAGQARGYLWLTPIFGSRFLIPAFGSITVPIEVIDDLGDHHMGTGLLLDEQTVLTCAHVLDGIKMENINLLDPVERAPMRELAASKGEMRVTEFKSHEEEDVAIIRFDRPASAADPLPGLVFRDPTRADKVTLLGFPSVPYARSAPLIAQSGEVSSTPLIVQHGESASGPVIALDGATVFLFSAVARPGNSGGAIVSSDGRVVGMVFRELKADTDRPMGLPFYAGLPASSVVAAVKSLGFDGTLEFED